MKVLLSQDVKGLGHKGELVDVSDGYGRNYLVPRGLAEPASDGSLRRHEAERKQHAQKKARELADAKAAAEKLSRLTVTLKVKAGASGKLFGAITSKDISQALKKQHGITLDKRRIQLDQPVKQLGTIKVAVKPHAEVQADMTVQVLAEDA